MENIKWDVIKFVATLLVPFFVAAVGFAFKFNSDHSIIGGRMSSLEAVTKQQLETLDWKIDQLYRWELDSRRGLK